MGEYSTQSKALLPSFFHWYPNTYCDIYKLIINVDQMGNYVLPRSSCTFHEKGMKQVEVVAKDEKRAYTLLVASTPEGTFLPFQQIWSGKTA